MTSAICTLFEGDYHFGVGALANSLYRFGYRGTIHVGYRGALPEWMTRTVIAPGSNHPPLDGLSFCYYPVKTPWHLANYKPDFIKTVFAASPEIQAVFYFDPDIVIKCPWSYYEEWVSHGLALVEEVATRGMAYNHPIRRRWLELARQLNLACRPVFSQYFNAGFVGVQRRCEHHMDDWIKIHRRLADDGMDMTSFMPVNRPHPFCGIDQDALNIVAMAAESSLSTIGPEGMDFVPGGFTMSHAVGSPKPWRKNYLLSALRGLKPSSADKAFWENVASPIRMFPDSAILRRSKMIRLASLIGRFYHQ